MTAALSRPRNHAGKQLTPHSVLCCQRFLDAVLFFSSQGVYKRPSVSPAFGEMKGKAVTLEMKFGIIAQRKGSKP